MTSFANLLRKMRIIITDAKSIYMLRLRGYYRSRTRECIIYRIVSPFLLSSLKKKNYIIFQFLKLIRAELFVEFRDSRIILCVATQKREILF